MKDGARGIQSIEVSGRILSAMVQSGRPMMLRDLAEAAGLKPAQCHAYLTSLKTVGLVHQDAATGLYSPGSMALRLGVSRLQNDPLAARARHELKGLTDDLAVMSMIVVWAEFGPTVVHTYAGPTQAALNLRQGSLLSITGSASGRVFAAYCDLPEIRSRIQDEIDHKSQSPSLGQELTFEDFTARVSEIRALGYSVARGSPIPDLNAISVPIFSEPGRVAFVAALIGRAERLPVEPDSPALRQLQELSNEISLAGTGVS